MQATNSRSGNCSLNAFVVAFNLDGELLDWVDLEREEDALMGIAFDSEGRLYVVDSIAEEVLRIDL